jgi:hypothetical protein
MGGKMKKGLKVFFISLTVILSIFISLYITLWAPYNLQSKLNENSLGMWNTKGIKEVPGIGEYFSSYDVVKVKYLGSSTYEVFTDKGNFIVIADYSDFDYWRYKIYQYGKEIEEFKNPM